ncbi:unnamed protein product [Brassica oleracea]
MAEVPKDRETETNAEPFIGVNYGQVADNLPPPSETAKLLQSTSIQKVRLYGADPAIIKALVEATSDKSSGKIQPKSDVDLNFCFSPNANSTRVQKNCSFKPPNLIASPYSLDDGDLSNQDFRFEDWSCFSDGGDAFPSFLEGTQRKERGELAGVDMPHTDEKADENCSNLGSCYSVTGKRPIERLNQTRYTKWFSPLVYDKKYGEIVDQKLNEKYVDEELEKVIFVRLMCAQSETESRPTISEVVEMLMNNLKEKMATTH